MDRSISITDRTKLFVIRIIKACTFLDVHCRRQTPGVCRTLSKQLLRCGTSIGANVRESTFGTLRERSAQSDKDFLSKMEIALKEARETEYWLEIIIESELVEKPKFNSLLREANEINIHCRSRSVPKERQILIASTRKIKDKINCQLSN